MSNHTNPGNRISITLWNSNGIARQSISTLTTAFSSSSLIFLTETWLLSPLRYPTQWAQYHTYGQKVENSYRGKMGITLLVNPDFPYPVSIFPSNSPYVFTCQINTTLIHCLYLPPSTLSNEDAIDILRSLPLHTHASQTNTIICGDLNARHEVLLGDRRTTPRGTMLAEWIQDSGLHCLNAELAHGIPTYMTMARATSAGESFSSVVDLFLSSHALLDPSLVVHENVSIGSDHNPLTLSLCLPSLPPPPTTHPRLLWNLSRLAEEDCIYESLFETRIQPFITQLINLTPSPNCPDFDSIGQQLVHIIHSSLDDSVGRKIPRPAGNSWFWNSELQTLSDTRDVCRRRWKRSTGVAKGVRWQEYLASCSRFSLAVRRRRRATWKQFCDKLHTQSFADTTSQIKTIRRNRQISNNFTHPEGPEAAAFAMSSHLRGIFAGDSLPHPHIPAPPSFSDPPHDLSSDECPIPLIQEISLIITKRLARRKAPGVDHIRAEMLVPIVRFLAPALRLLFLLCWRWSKTPSSWRVAQVIPIYKKGDPTQAANYRPISLTSVFRKILEMAITGPLVSSSPALDIAQGGFRAFRGAPDQALCLQELCIQHTIDHGLPPMLAFLDIKSAYDTVDRGVIWRTLETYVPNSLIGLLQNLFDEVSIEVLISGAHSPRIWPATGVLQGSILSPFLYSIYINSLPRQLRTPITHPFISPPPRLYNDLWLNCLLYADDVVIIGTEETMPILLSRVERHSLRLGYRWNPSKCIVLKPPLPAPVARRYGDSFFPATKLYGEPIPTASSFNYLGIPFNNRGNIDSEALVTRNCRSALGGMRALHSVGLHAAGFSRLLSARLYAVFIRPKFEYGLSVSRLLQKHNKALDRSQNQCLRLAFGGHPKSSTAVYKHMTGLPSMKERVSILVFKMAFRFQSLPDDTLVSQLLPLLTSTHQHWPKIFNSNPILQEIPDEERLDIPLAQVKPRIKMYRLGVLDSTLTRLPRPPVLLSACRKSLQVDPILLLPMSNTTRSRLVRWRMGWLPARPLPCRCGAPHASRDHLMSCLSIASKLQIDPSIKPNPVDFVLNLLPRRKPTQLSSPLQHHHARWLEWWPVLCQFFLQVDLICHPNAIWLETVLDPTDNHFLKWFIQPETPQPNITQNHSTD